VEPNPPPFPLSKSFAPPSPPFTGDDISPYVVWPLINRIERNDKREDLAASSS